MASTHTAPSVIAKSEKVLKSMPLWQAGLYPIVFLFVGIFTWSKDLLFKALPLRQYKPYVFEPSQFGTWIFDQELQVLVVDDSDLHQEVSLRLLDKSDSSVDFAYTGAEAIEACAKKHYDLVLMDIFMPGMSGLEATVEIRRQSSSKAIRIIAVTGSSTVDRESLHACGVDGYLTKPLISMELQKQLRVSAALRKKAV